MLAQSSCALGSETTEAIVQALLRLDQDPVRVSGTESLELLWISGASLKNSADRVSGTESLSSLVRAAPC
ncbi:hypothetical protein ACVWWY_002119 [Thermostichus sp. OS-CIW-38]